MLADPQDLLTSSPADLNDIMMDMVAVGERHGIRFPRDFALLFKQMLYFDRFMRIWRRIQISMQISVCRWFRLWTQICC